MNRNSNNNINTEFVFEMQTTVCVINPLHSY